MNRRQLVLVLALTPTLAWAEPAAPAKKAPYTLSGYVEGYYQWNFRSPENHVTHFRGFDNRHNAFTLSNAALGATWDDRTLLGRLVLQVGHTPATYYASEPSFSSTSGANATGSELFRYIQEANGGVRLPWGNGLTLTMGIFLSPIGPETIPVKDNWNFSRSTLFYGLPFYHTGLRAGYELTPRLTTTIAVYNGWNSVVDNNAEKSFAGQFSYAHKTLALSFLYFGGVERGAGALEGRAFRHLFDAHATWHPHRVVSLLLHTNLGFEPNLFGTSHWLGVAMSARFRIAPSLFVAVRADTLREAASASEGGDATPIFFPSPWVSSNTATFDFRPHPQVSLRAEFRRDHAGRALYFGNSASSPSLRAQETATLGLVTWF